MIVGMTPRKEKIAVTLPPELVASAKRAVDSGRASSVSAYIAEALAEKEERDDLRVLLDEMLEETGGPVTDAERRWADEILRGT